MTVTRSEKYYGNMRLSSIARVLFLAKKATDNMGSRLQDAIPVISSLSDIRDCY